MKLTNTLDLPEPLVGAIRNDSYTKGERVDFSVTELALPPRITALRREHAAHIEEDVSDRIFSLLGRSVHTILQNAASDRYLVETRLFLEHDGLRISGQIDLYEIEACKLQDWKVTSRHTTSDAKLKYPWSSKRTVPEGKGWIEQANIYRLMLIEAGYEVESMEVVAIYRDWSKMQALRVSEYPEHQIERLVVPKWSLNQTRSYLSERIALHLAAREELPECSAEERWEKPSRWALMKKGRKRATKLYDTEVEAQSMVAEAGDHVEPRHGEPIRCLHYCGVLPFCTQGQALVQDLAGV